jgi:hypothetical protein
MSRTIKLWERVIQRKLKKEIQIIDKQFKFMLERSTMKAIYLLRFVM